MLVSRLIATVYTKKIYLLEPKQGCVVKSGITNEGVGVVDGIKLEPITKMAGQ
ncbi:hypothetical protein D3C73_1259830 [compost metagenome]